MEAWKYALTIASRKNAGPQEEPPNEVRDLKQFRGDRILLPFLLDAQLSLSG